MSTSSDKLWDLIEENPTCMMVSANRAGQMHGRPMHAILNPAASELLFYTRISSGKSEELESDGDVCLCFGCPKSSDYVSITGHAVLTTDEALIRKHWNTFVDAWFPEGPTGGDVGVIRVKADQGEYWDGNSSSVLSALKMAIASAKDEMPDLGENRKVAL